MSYLERHLSAVHVSGQFATRGKENPISAGESIRSSLRACARLLEEHNPRPRASVSKGGSEKAVGRRWHGERHETSKAETTYLLQSLVVDEASSILGDFELPLLDLLPKLPAKRLGGSAVPVVSSAGGEVSPCHRKRDTHIMSAGAGVSGRGEARELPQRMQRTGGGAAFQWEDRRCGHMQRLVSAAGARSNVSNVSDVRSRRPLPVLVTPESMDGLGKGDGGLRNTEE